MPGLTSVLLVTANVGSAHLLRFAPLAQILLMLCSMESARLNVLISVKHVGNSILVLVVYLAIFSLELLV